MTEPYYHCGKEVLRDGCHLLDACDSETAEAITILLNCGVLLTNDLPQSEIEKVQRILWNGHVTA